MLPLTHDVARAWLAERLDWALDEERRRALETHLEGCPACRAVDEEYRRDRAALRLLRAPLPPRDLWARTSAALDRESHRRATPAAAPRRPAEPRAASRFRRGAVGGLRRRLGVAPLVASLAMVTITALVGSQLLPGGLLAPHPRATPIALAPEPLAYIGIQGNQVVLVRARLDRVCPVQTVDCAELPAGTSQVVGLPSQVDLSALAMDPRGEHAAVAGQAGNQTTFYVINLPPLPATVPPATGSPATPGGGNSGAPSAVPSPSASATPAPATATTTARPSSATPRPSVVPRRSGTPTPIAAPTTAPRSPALTHRPSGSPLRTATATRAPEAAVGSPSGAGTPPGTSVGSPSAGPETPEASGVAEVALAQVILSDVVPTGLSAAWAPDGSTLAFSAMPADGSHGSDIYTWQPGDLLAEPVTDNHDSYFSSWAGGWIVGSSTSPSPDDPQRLQAHSFVIDPATGEQRPLRLSDVWLPSVDPTGQYVAFWRGDLHGEGALPNPGEGALPTLGEGALEFDQWAALDPFARGSDAATPGATPAATPSAPASATPHSAPGTRRPDAAHRPSGSSTRPAPTPAGTDMTGAPRERIPDLSPAPTPTPPAEPQPVFPPELLPTASPASSAPTPGASSSVAPGGDAATAPAEIGAARTAASGSARTSAASPAGRPELSAAGSSPATVQPVVPGASTPGSGGSAAPSALATGAVPVGAGASASPNSVVIGDYAIAWASDGSALGVWRADSPGALDGLLSVFSIDPETGRLVTSPPFLGPTPAQRFFSMGSDRIAWTTPPDAFGSSQLHVVAWGAFGRGELRRSLDQRRLLTAF